jgi:predicted Zn-ribbon and HTH transcriptional regulator
MSSPQLTARQHLMNLLAGTRRTSRELAELLAISERQIEDHLTHIVRSVARDRTRRFILEPSTCHDCGFIFRERTRLTRPSRCPRCRSEAIAPPRYGIDLRPSPKSPL